MVSRAKHIKFGCPYCGQRGEVVWNSDNAGRELIRLSNGFHIEEEHHPGERLIIICNVCDEIDAPGVVNPRFYRNPHA